MDHNSTSHLLLPEIIDISDSPSIAAPAEIDYTLPYQIPSKPKATKKAKNSDENNGYVFLAAYKKKAGDRLIGKPTPIFVEPKRVTKPRAKTIPKPEQQSDVVLPAVDESNNCKPKKKRVAKRQVKSPQKKKVEVEKDEDFENLGIQLENEEVTEEDNKDLSVSLALLDDEIKRRKALNVTLADLTDTVQRHKIYAKFFLDGDDVLKPIQEKGDNFRSIFFLHIFHFNLIIFILCSNSNSVLYLR